MSRYFKRYNVLHGNGVVGGAGIPPVVPPSLDLALAQTALNVNAGASVDVGVTLARTNYTPTVTLAVSGLPPGVTGAFAPPTLVGATLTSVLTLTAAGGAAAVDDAPFTVTASGAGIASVAKSATLDVNAAPSTGITAIAIKGMRHDGLTGNARASGLIQFAPGAVQATDLANVTVWDANGQRVGCYVEDIGARHLSAGAANGLLGAHLQFDTTFAAPGSEPAFTVKFDQTVTAADRIAAQAYTEFTQSLNIQVSGTDASKLRLNADVTCHPYDQNAPIRVLAQDILWGYNDTPPIPATGFATVIVRLAVRHATGQVYGYAKHATGSTQTAASSLVNTVPGAWYHDYGSGGPTIRNIVGESVIGYASLYIAAGTAAKTLGTSLLTDAGITVGTTGSGHEPFSTLPTEIPVASLAPSSPTYLCATEFPGYKLTPEATDPVPFLVAQRRKGSDWVWGRLGWFTYMIGGQPWYNNCLEEWIMYARNAEARYYRRSLATEKAYRTWAGPSFTGLGEAQVDATQPLVYCALTQRPADTLNVAAAVEVAAARATLKQNESAEYRGHSLSAPGLYSTGRFAMHVFQVVSWFGRLGIDPGAAYVVVPSQDGELWPNAAAWATVSTAQGHFARMCDRVHTSMRTDAANSPGMRYLGMPNYDDYGCFMSGWLTSYLALALKTFGVPEQYPGGPLSNAPGYSIVQDLVDTVEYPFTALSKWTAEPYYVDRPAVGGKAFVYETPGGIIIDSTESSHKTTIATGMTVYNPSTMAVASIAPLGVPAPSGKVRVRTTVSGALPTVYDYTGTSAPTGAGNLTGVTYVAGPHTAYPAGTTLQAHLNAGNSAGVNLNATWLYAIAYLKQTTAGATSALWKARGDLLYLGLQDTTNFAGQGATALSTFWWAKELPESDLIGSCWTAESA